MRRKEARSGDLWHLDEVRIVIRDQPHWLCRAVDQDGYVLDEILQTRRNTEAARRLLTRLLKRQGLRPSRKITDKLKSYEVARRKIRLAIRHLSQGSEQPGGEQSSSFAKTRTHYAEVPFTGRMSAFRVRLLSHPKSLRPVRVHHHRLFPAHPSYQGLRSVGQRDRSQRLKISFSGVVYLTSVNVTAPIEKQTQIDAVQLYSPAYSRIQGGQLSAFSRQMKAKLGLK